MVNTADNSPPYSVRNTDAEEWLSPTTQENKTERKPKEMILWIRSLPSLLKL
jgi:hypothetical protein